MTFTVVSWIKTEYWQGALVERETDGKQFLTNGIFMWEPREDRKFQVLPNISKRRDMVTYWQKYFPYYRLDGASK